MSAQPMDAEQQDQLASQIEEAFTAQSAPTEAPQETDEVAEQEPETPVEEEFDLDPELPDEIQAELEEPDPDDIEEEEFVEDAEEEEEYVDEAVLAERKKRQKLEKKLAWIEEQKLKADRKTWITKDEKFFPWADLDRIAEMSKSRRQFLRAAKDENDRLKKKLLPRLKKIMDKEEAVAEQVKSEAREEAAKAWGKPTSGPGVPQKSQEIQSKLEQARERRDLTGAIGVLLGMEEKGE